MTAVRASSEQVANLGRALRRSIRKDRRDWVHRISLEVEDRIQQDDVIGAYALLRLWYRLFTGRAPTPSQEVMENERGKYETLFRADTLPADLPFDFQPDADLMDNTVPEEEEIRHAVFRMRSRKAPGLTMVSVDHLK